MRFNKSSACVTIGAAALAVLTMCGCWGAEPQAANMVPESVGTVGKSGKTLRVVAMTEGQPGSRLAQAFALETMSEARISGAMFGRALTDTLARSGLFASVTTESKADYELRATLFEQRASTLGLGYTSARIGVRYRLVEMDSGRVAWRDTIYSEADSSFGHLSTIVAESEANERAMKGNLAQLVDALSHLNLAQGRTPGAAVRVRPDGSRSVTAGGADDGRAVAAENLIPGKA